MSNKVLLFCDPESIHTKKWKDGWEYIGYNVIISGISSNNYKDKLLLKGKISSSGNNGTIYLKNIFKFWKILKRVDPAIINAHYLTSYGLISALIKRKKDILIMSLHGTDIMRNMDKNLIYLMMAKYTLNRSELIVSVSEVMTNKILKYFPHLKEKILTQQYGVDIDLLNNFNSLKKDIFLSTNRQWKENSNYPIILEALNNFSEKNIKIIGYDNSEYSRNLILNFKNLEKFSTGLVTYKENLTFVGKSKIFISFTSSDGISLSLIEAMYLGAIPIVSDISPNQEIIKDGINGFLVPVKLEELIWKIEKIGELDDNKIKNIQENNKKLVLEKFNFEKNFNNFKKVLMEKINKYDK